MTGRKFSQLILIEFFAIFQGLTFGLVPGLNPLLTNPDFHNLSQEGFQILFIPFILAAVLLALIAGWIGQREKLKGVFIVAMAFNFIALALIASTTLFFDISFVLLLLALFFMGGGVSVAMIILSRWMFALFPDRPFRSTLILWASASFGMLISGGVVAYALILHKWWLAPLLVLFILFVLLLIIDLFDEYPEVAQEKNGGLSWQVGFFLVPALLYGYFSTALGELFLTFWAVTTVTRLVVGILFPLLPAAVWYCVLPIGIFYEPLRVVALAALLPINLVWMQKRFSGKATLVTGLGVACYLFGTALSRFQLDMALIGGAVLLLFHLIAAVALPAQKK